MVIYRVFFLCFSFLQLLGLSAFTQLVLPNIPLSVAPTEFYIAAVTAKNPDAGTQAIGNYIEQNLKKNRTLRPVVLEIKQFNVVETITADGRVLGYLYLTLSFSLQKDYGTAVLLSYPGKLRYTRSVANKEAIARNLQVLIQTGLTFFNDWMMAHVADHPLLASSVKLSFTDYTENLEGDTIYYSPKRLLTWADFQAKYRPPGLYEAMVIPGLGYTQEVKLSKGTLEVLLSVKVFLPKSAAWVAPGGRNNYALNHEQRHFDIVKIIAEQFKQKLSATKLTPDNFEGIINVQYLDSLRDLDALQKAYDRETSHGMNRNIQSAWNFRIDALLTVP